jgi:hypothetical protein
LRRGARFGAHAAAAADGGRGCCRRCISDLLGFLGYV